MHKLSTTVGIGASILALLAAHAGVDGTLSAAVVAVAPTRPAALAAAVGRRREAAVAAENDAG